MADIQKRDSHTASILFALLVAELSSAFEISMIFAGMATFIREFGNPERVFWLVTAFLLVSAGAAAICGRLGDVYGRSRVMVVVLGIAVLGSLISAFASTLEGIILGRAIQGASAAVLPLCLGLVRERLPQAKVPFGVAMLVATASVGGGIGIVLGGLIIDHLTWHWMFYCSAAVAAIGAVLVLAMVPPSARKGWDGRPDVLGGILFVPAICAVLLAISLGSRAGWTHSSVLVTLALGLALLAVWVGYELRHPNPLINVRLLGDRRIAVANAAMALTALGAMQIAQVLALLFQQPRWTMVGLGVSATFAGLLKIPSNLSGLIGAPLSGAIAARRSSRDALLAGSAVLAAGWIALLLSHGSVWIVATLTVITGIGVTMVYTAVPNLVIEGAPLNRTSEATGLSMVTRGAFQAIGAQLVAVSLASSTISDPSHGPGSYPTQAAFTLTFAWITVSCIVCFLVALGVPRRISAASARTGAAQSA
ncbi:MAG: MFS transporter [Steroidobacteraceae bacterium]